jgi:predicted O-methyltransferase YrrM
MAWIENIVSAWKGHRVFAEWLVSTVSPSTIVELGVDYGYSTFVFANALKGTQGTIYGIDLFTGDQHAGSRDTYAGVMDAIRNRDVTNIEIVRGDFTAVSKLWSKPIDVLHIDGLHTYEAVKNDFTCWSPLVKESGIVLFHDVAIPQFGIKKFFSEIEGYKLYFTHSAGLGIWTKNKALYETILATFNNCYDFNSLPLRI